MTVPLAAASTGGRWQWKAFGAVALTATAAYALQLSPLVCMLAYAAVGVGTVTALTVGPRLHRAPLRHAWGWIALASVLFLVGPLIRPSIADGTGLLRLGGDMFTLPADLCLLYGIWLLRARGALERHAVIDGLLVCLGTAMATALLLAVPTAAVPGRSVAASVLAGLFPFFDVAVLVLLVNMAFTTAARQPAFAALIAGGVLFAIGDTAYAVIGLSGKVHTSPLLDLPFLLAYTMLGVMALHPTVAVLGDAARRPVQAWSWLRVALIGPALAVPFLLIALVGGRSIADRLAVATGGLLMVLLLVARAMSAVRGQVTAQLRAQYQARHDLLTGLPNRRMMSAEIERLLTTVPESGPQQVWVFFLDLDAVRWVNDFWGHDTGDQLIIEVAGRLRRAVAGGTMLARVGGDGFLIACAGDQAAADRTIAAMATCFGEPVRVRGTEVVISASIGIAHTTGDHDAPAVTAQTVLRDADTAMCRSKALGQGRCMVYDSSMGDEVRERIELEVALRTALAEGQLHVVVYQPIVNLNEGSPLGAEVLVRWDHPERGAIPPTVFIPIAERAGMMRSIGTYVRVEALRQLARWRADGTVAGDFWMSINVSPRQLRDPDLPSIMTAELMELGLPPEVVVLEITESVMVDSSSLTDQVLFELRELGVRLVVDDFGTGSGAVAYLHRFPVTGVKIDGSFVAGLGTDAGAGAGAGAEEIVRAVVAMSAALGLSTVAEGVETRLQRDALSRIGVVIGQGWLWGRAVTAPQFAARWSIAALVGAAGTAAPGGAAAPVRQG
jgi:diguanylate cyclase (GGDEF)-like protein